MVISRTPVRLSFFGGGTDYREYFERSKGAVLGKQAVQIEVLKKTDEMFGTR